MRVCYVAMPFGVKPRADGSPQDFEFFFREGIKPAIAEFGMDCRRFDDFGVSAFWQKSMFTGIISSDVMIADISTSNPNILYELGVRHALRRGRTILVAASGERAPSNIGYANILFYDLDGTGGRLSEPSLAVFRERLVSILRQSARSTISDSPIYEFFPALEAVLPPELAGDTPAQKSSARRGRDRTTKRTFSQAVVESPKQVVNDLQKSEQAVRAPDANPVEFLTLLRRYRDLSEWDRVIGLAQDAPPASQSPEVRQLLALALNRRGAPGDQRRAISVMEDLIRETGGDGETYGILGRIHKDRYEKAIRNKQFDVAAECLERALQSYRAGYSRSQDVYSGINIVSLLQERDDAAAYAEINEIVPRVRATVEDRIEAGWESGRVDYWDLATAVELAVAVRDWAAARNAVDRVSQTTTAAWMIESTVRTLRRLLARMSDPKDRDALVQIIGQLQEAIEAA
jgi:hypothetical protein